MKPATADPLGSEPTCRVCGCTFRNPCFDPLHGPCGWAEPDLCTACERTERERRRARRDGLFLGLAIAAGIIVLAVVMNYLQLPVDPN